GRPGKPALSVSTAPSAQESRHLAVANPTRVFGDARQDMLPFEGALQPRDAWNSAGPGIYLQMRRTEGRAKDTIPRLSLLKQPCEQRPIASKRCERMRRGRNRKQNSLRPCRKTQR